MSHHGSDPSLDDDNRRRRRSERRRQGEQRRKAAQSVLVVERPNAKDSCETAACNVCEGDTSVVVRLGCRGSSVMHRLCFECAKLVAGKLLEKA